MSHHLTQVMKSLNYYPTALKRDIFADERHILMEMDMSRNFVHLMGKCTLKSSTMLSHQKDWLFYRSRINATNQMKFMQPKLRATLSTKASSGRKSTRSVLSSSASWRLLPQFLLPSFFKNLIFKKNNVPTFAA